MQSQFLDVPEGKIAAVVTHLEMFARPAPRPVTGPATSAATSGPFHLQRHDAPDLAWYRDLFMRVGGQDWMWFSRLGLTDEELSAILWRKDVWVYSLRHKGRDEGMLELDFRTQGECELGYFGLTPAMVGQGAGRWLMEQALELAWSQPIGRFHVHTCTLDSPQALPFYMRSGFTAYRRQIEIADDPRKTGVLPAQSCPQEPVI